MQGSSDRAHPSRRQRGVERNNCMARCQARWDAISPARDTDTRRAGKDARVALSTRLHDAPPSATAQALLDGQRYRRDTFGRNNSKRADTSVKAEPRRVTNLFSPAARPGWSTRGSRVVRDVCAADRCATRCPPSHLAAEARRAALESRPVFRPTRSRIPARVTVDRSLQSTTRGDCSRRSMQAASTPALARRHGTRGAESRQHW
jgi:hypothetical protein